MPTLIVMTGPESTKQVPLRIPETRIGRSAENDVVIDSQQVSRFHAVLAVDGPFVTIRDLDSRNGVYVNGAKVDSQVLAHGDGLVIGGCQMRYLASDQEFTAIEALRLATVPGLLIDLDRKPEPSRRSG